MKKFILVLFVIAVVGLVVFWGLKIGFGGGASFVFFNTSATSNEVKINESQIYFNDKVVEFEQLAEKLQNLEIEKKQIKLIDDNAKSILFQKVEKLLEDEKFTVIKISEPDA